ncbi:uncharacterized protein FIBRA_05250 [Fibroporia radiculosa]|uniref:GDP-fucose protein O-fucosyltransferase 2 n=1 Tax=Fibroporia radiculosa TaxID=599839 RepID=J4H3E4_9APHY|nr:uncharacterized protein FIBRA_05250 [Fibroporia radiculosa]CCM03129.1 predicted protein [Fibroporia radiculosa]
MKEQGSFDDLRDDYAAHDRAESSEPLLKEHLPPLQPSFSIHRVFRINPRLRRLILMAFASLSTLSLITFASVSIFASRPDTLGTVPPPENIQPETGALETNSSSLAIQDKVADTPSHSPYVLGPPTQRFRDNLRNDTLYITSWISAGWTNDVMTYANLIYLGVLTGRVPLISVFTPSHVGGEAGNIPFGDVFDVPRFIQDSGIDIIEWRDVKDPYSPQLEDIGCWNLWESVQYHEHAPRISSIPDWLQLDISYTRTPEWVKMIPNYEHDQHSTFWSVARFGFSEDRSRYLGNPSPSPHHQVTLDPDEQVLCFDYLYYLCAQQSFEYEYDYAPAWRFVGTYLRWTPRIEDLAASYVRRSFGLLESDATPPYISIHVRHGDFRSWCPSTTAPEDCFAPISAIARRVQEVQDEIRERHYVSIPDNRVIVTTDETDEAWWADVTSRGWVRIDHDAWQTAQTYGKWYTVILDAAIQSNGLGFIGTDRSTFTTLSRRRVHDWHAGATRVVKWGVKDADAH